MPIKRKTALVIIFLFTLILFFFLTGINTCTVIYHNFDGTGEIYTKTYFTPPRPYQHGIILDTPKESDSFLFSGWHTDQGLESEIIYEIKPEETVNVYADWMRKNPETDFLLPEIHISSETAIDALNRTSYNTCTYMITNTGITNCMASIPGQIKGRGNSTWENFDKKSYRIKFDSKQDLFGMGESKNWVLLSNSMDYTLMRNEIALGLGRIIGLPYTSECQWIHLFYNEEYRGLYLLCELVETGINRVDIEIPFDTEDIDINFFLELGGELNGFPLSPVEGADTNWGDYFSCEIIYPVNNVITRHQEEYIYAYMQLVNEAILTRNWESIIDLADIRSFADWYLVNEIVLNADIGWSMFAYKLQGDKLYLGPLWDFDQTCGVSISCGPDYETWYPASKTQNTWFNTLLEMDEFKALLASRWKECLPEIQHFLAEEQQKSVLYQKDIAANFERWPALGTTVWRMRKEIGDFDTYEENTAYLFDWLENRIEWLSSELGSY